MDDREKRLKEIEKAGKIQGAQMAQNEIASLTQEQKNNLLQEKQVLMQQAQQRAMVSQAAEMGVQTAADLSQSQAPTQQKAGINAQTQQILSKYGINPQQKVAPQTTTTTRNSSKVGATTVENITNTTTTNHNVVRIIQPNIPVTQPNIAMRQGAISNAKFKSWLQKANAQQEEIATSQMNEYNRRERSLLRSTDRMMRKLQDLSKSIGTSLDPENMTNTISGSLKTLMFLFITTMIPIVWKPIMEKIETFEANFRSFFGMELPGSLKSKANPAINNWKQSLGLEGDLDNASVPGAVLKLVKSSFDELMAKMQNEAEDRKEAVSQAQQYMPDSLTDIEGWAKYLGKVIVAAIGGSEGQAVYSEGSRIQEEKVKEIENEEFELNGKKISMLGEFDERGNLRNEDSALKLTQSLANETNKETVDLSKIQASVEKLKSFHNKTDKLIPLSPEFVQKIQEIVPEERINELIKKYNSKGEYRENNTDYVFTHRKSDFDPSSQYSIWDRINQWQSRVGAAGTAAGATAGAVASGFGIVPGACIGYMLGSIGGSIVGLGHGLIDMTQAHLRAPGAQLSLVPLSGLSEGEKRNMNFHKNYAPALVQEVSPEFIQELLGMTKTNKSTFSSENYQGLKKTVSTSGKKTVTDKRYHNAIQKSIKVKEKNAALDEENTQTNRFFKTADRSLPVKDAVPSRSENDNSSSMSEQVAKVPDNIKDTARNIMDYFKKALGITEEQAAGIAGNLMQESSLNAKAVNKSSGAKGLAQWLGPRKKALHEKFGDNPSFEDQLNFIVQELNSTHTNALRALKQSKTVEDSTKVFGAEFERPGWDDESRRIPLHYQKRLGYAKSFYNVNGKTSESKSTTPTWEMKYSVNPDDIGFDPFNLDRNYIANYIDNATLTDTSSNTSEEDKLKTIADTTKALAETSAVIAAYDSVPPHQIINVKGHPASVMPQTETGWTSQQ